MREIAAHSGRGGSRPLRAVVDVWRNPHSRLLLMVFLIESMGAATLGILGPYVMEYVIGDESLFPRLLLSFFLPTVLFIPIVLPLSRRLGKKNTWALKGRVLYQSLEGLVNYKSKTARVRQ